MDIATILSLISFAVEEEPKVADAIRNLFTKSSPTPADWQAEADKWRANTYQVLVPDSKLPPEPVQGPNPQAPG